MSFFIMFGLFCLVFALGCASGYLLKKFPPVVGSFTINHSDPAKDFCSLKLDVDLPELEENHTFALKLIKIDSNEGDTE